MTDETHDPSADHMTVIAQRMRGFTELRQYADDVDALADERDTLAARLAEVERDLDEACNDAQDKETSADYWHEESRLQYERAEAAEAKLAAARGAIEIAETATATGDGLTPDATARLHLHLHEALALLDADAPAIPRASAWQPETDGQKADYDRARAIYTPGERQAAAESPAPRECMHMTAEMARNCRTCNPEGFATTDAEGMWLRDMEAGVYDEDMPAPRDGVTVGGFYGEYTPITITSQSLTAGDSSSEWRPKETAPKDGRWFEAVRAGEFAPGELYLPQAIRWQGDGWEKPDEGQTTIVEINFDFWRDYDFAALRALTEGGE
jgi:hypothetical protein